MARCLVLLFGCLIIWPANAAFAAPVVELTVGETSWQGRNDAHNREICWLVAPDGSYTRINLSEVTDFRKVAPEFQSISPSALARELKSILGRRFEVRQRGDFVVCAPPGKAGDYLELVTDVQRGFRSYLSRRGWSVDQPEFPLVVMVYPTREEFEKECLIAGMPVSPYLKGFYHPQTNRVTLFDQTSEAERSTSGSSDTELEEGNRSIAIHETIHQLAFNTGLHQRIGKNPRWVMEGLATLLETGVLDSAKRKDSQSRVNPQRLARFRDYRKHRRTGTVADLITADEEFYRSNPLDFYAESWALTFYLSEARRPDYVRYLKRIAERDPLDDEYTAQERLDDFQAVFGTDLRWLDVKFLRFMDSLD